MPTKKVSTKTQTSTPSTITSLPNKLINYRKTNPIKFWGVILIIAILLFLFVKKNLVVAALVNGQPITNLELQMKLNKQFRTQTLSQMVNEKLLAQEASKKGVVVSQSDLDAKVKEIEEEYGGAESLNAILEQQGIIREDFIAQTKLQLMVEKLYSGEASPSAEDVEKFMTENKDAPEATEPAKFRKTAETQVRDQNLSRIFQEKFQALKEAAKIQIF